MSSAVEEIKARLNIVEVVGSYIKVEKAGSSYKALCPFHQEKSASFNVSPSRQAYYCFGCNRGGDMFTFVEEIEGVQFIDALKILAERAGIVLSREESEGKSDRERMLSIMEESARFYEGLLAEHKDAFQYLKGRGLTDETIATFRIGFVPTTDIAGWRPVHTYLREKGFTDEEIERAGLTKKVQPKPGSGSAKEGYYDRFRSRIMFPIRDQGGRTVAFSGRIFGNAKNSDGSDVAKYINSPETPLYDKSTVLFGYDMAKSAIRKQNFTVVVEGQMDLIMAHQAGTTNTVAVSGTALTEKHLGLLKRLSDNVVFAFDSDQAGVNATTRAFHLALALGLNVRVARMGEKDPADLILKDPESWQKALAESVHIIDSLLLSLKERHSEQSAYRKAVEEEVIPLLIAIPSRIERAHFIIEIARRLSVPEDAVWEEVKRREQTRAFVLTSTVKTPPSSEVFRKTPRHNAEERIVAFLLWQEKLTTPSVDVSVIRERYEKLIQESELEPYTPEEDELMGLIARAEHEYDGSTTLEETIDESLHRLEREVLRERQADLWKKLSDAEQRGDKEEAARCLAQYQTLTPRIIALETGQ